MLIWRPHKSGLAATVPRLIQPLTQNKQRKDNTIDISETVEEVALGVIGDSRVMAVYMLTRRGRVKQGSLKVFLEDREQDSRFR